MNALDTSLEAARMQFVAYQRMGPERRVRRAAAMCEEGREIVREGIRARHPEYGEKEVRDALFRLLLGDVLFREVYPDRPLLSP